MAKGLCGDFQLNNACNLPYVSKWLPANVDEVVVMVNNLVEHLSAGVSPDSHARAHT